MKVLLWIMDRYDTKIDLIKYMLASDLFLWSIDFAQYLQDCLMEDIIFGIMDQCDTKVVLIKQM